MKFTKNGGSFPRHGLRCYMVANFHAGDRGTKTTSLDYTSVPLYELFVYLGQSEGEKGGSPHGLSQEARMGT